MDRMRERSRGETPILDRQTACGIGSRLGRLIGLCVLVCACDGDEPSGPQFDTLTVTTASLPAGIDGASYGPETLTATGGNGSYLWGLASGSGPLPAGLSLGSDGVIDGTPTASGAFGFTVEVSSGDGQQAQRTLSVSVDPTPVLQADQLCSANPGYVVVGFDDAALESAVRSALSIGALDDLTCDLAATLTSLQADDVGITSLAGIQNLTGLTTLNLELNDFDDLARSPA